VSPPPYALFDYARVIRLRPPGGVHVHPDGVLHLVGRVFRVWKVFPAFGAVSLAIPGDDYASTLMWFYDELEPAPDPGDPT
jgi:hypothetical protein